MILKCSILISLFIAGPRTFEDWMDYLNRPIEPRTPLNYNKDRVTSIRDAADDRVIIIDNGDSQMGASENRSTGAVDNYLDAVGIELLGILMPFTSHGSLDLRFNPLGTAGNWIDHGELGIHDAWDDGNTSHHMSFSHRYALQGPISGESSITEYLVPTDLFDLDDQSRITFRMFYRMINSNPLKATLTPVREQSGPRDRTTKSASIVTLEPGNGDSIGYVDYVHPTGTYWTSDPSNSDIGFTIRVDADDTENPPMNGNELNLLGVLVYQSSSVNQTNILDTTKETGLVYCPLYKPGFDASELRVYQSSIVRKAVVSTLAQITGDGTTDNPDPIDTIGYKLGHNEDIITGDYTQGLALLRNEWNQNIADTTLDGHATHDFYAPWGTIFLVNRMRSQADELFQFCKENNHGFTNEFLFYNETNNLETLSGLNPFGNPYGTYTMDTPGTHPDNSITPRQIWLDKHQHTDPKNKVSILELIRSK